MDPQAAWWRLSLRLTGESDEVRVAALRALRQTPDLEATLRAALETDRRFLALDAITALKLHGLEDDLLRFAEHDATGFSYSAINALLTDANRDRILQLYRKRAVAPETSPASRMVLLDTLGRLNEPLMPSDLDRLLRDPSYETRAAALSHLREVLLRLGLLEYLPLVNVSFDANPRILRLQALFLLKEVAQTHRLPESIRAFAKACAHPPLEAEALGLCHSAEGARR